MYLVNSYICCVQLLITFITMKNKFTYNVKDGSVSGVFNIYQDRKGALRLLMGNRHTELTFSQINDLMINVYDLIDFDYDEFMNYYN